MKELRKRGGEDMNIIIYSRPKIRADLLAVWQQIGSKEALRY
jgi:hypothetical protein